MEELGFLAQAARESLATGISGGKPLEPVAGMASTITHVEALMTYLRACSKSATPTPGGEESDAG